MNGKKNGNLLYERELIKLSDTYLREEPVLDNPKEKFIYRTSSIGGVEGRTSEYHYFESLESAVLNALTSTWNESFKVSRLRLSVDGEIKVLEYGEAKRITCLWDLWRESIVPVRKVPEFDYDSLPSMKILLSSYENVKQTEEKDNVKQMVKKI